MSSPSVGSPWAKRGFLALVVLALGVFFANGIRKFHFLALDAPGQFHDVLLPVWWPRPPAKHIHEQDWLTNCQIALAIPMFLALLGALIPPARRWWSKLTLGVVTSRAVFWLSVAGCLVYKPLSPAPGFQWQR